MNSNELGKGIAVAGMWIAVGIASIYDVRAGWGFIASIIGTCIVYG